MTVIINGRTAVHQKSEGKLNTTDVCLTPPYGIPIPFSNLAQSQDLQQAAQTVFVNGNPIAHLKSIFVKSSGDAGGIAGISSGSLSGKAEFLQGSPNVFVEGNAAVRSNDPMVSNNRNTPSAPLTQQPANPPADVQADNNSAQQQTPTTKAIDIDRVGNGPLNIFNSVVAYDPGTATRTPLATAGDSTLSNSVVARHTLLNVADTHTALALQIIGSEGTIDVPLSTQPITLRQTTQQTAPVAGQAPNCLVPCRIAWQTFPYSKKLNVSAGDFTDIARFDEQTRQKIYQDLLAVPSDKLMQTPWTQLINRPLLNYCQLLLDDHVVEPLSPGWIYIFKDGFLWREVAVTERGDFQEINLLQEAGNEQRIATGVATDYLVLPYQINNTVSVIEMAYSSVQWSWARINYFGGMDPQDPRIAQQDQKPAMPSDLPKGPNTSARSQRFTKIDLSAFVTPTSTVGKTTSQETEPVVILTQQNQVPTILLADPLSIAARLTLDLQWMNLLVQKARTDAVNEPYFRSALLAYRTFFDVRNAHTQQETVANPAAFYPGTNGMIPAQTQIIGANDNLAASQYLDRAQLEKILRVNDRQKIRALMKALQTSLMNILLSRGASWYQQPISVSQVLPDLFANANYNYSAPYAIVAGFLSATTLDPDNLDSSLDIVTGQANNYTPPGADLVTALSDSSSVWFKSVFPDDDSINHFDQLAQQDAQIGDHINMDKAIAADVGDGSFNLMSYIQTARGLEQSYELFEQSVATILRCVTKQLAVDKTPTMFQRLAAWLRATGQPNLAGITTAETGKIPEGYEIIGLEMDSLTQYSQKKIAQATYPSVHKTALTPDEKQAIAATIQQGRALSSELKQKLSSQPIDLMYQGPANDANNGKVLRQFTAASVTNNTGASLESFWLSEMTPEKLSGMIKDEIHTGNTGKKLNRTVLIHPVTIVYHTLTGLDRGMKIINLGARTYNLATLKTGIEAHSGVTGMIGYPLLALGYFSYAIEDLYLSFHEVEQVNKLYTEVLQLPNAAKWLPSLRNNILKSWQSALTPLAVAGLVANAIDLGFNTTDMIQQLRKGNSSDAAISGLSIGADILNGMSIFIKYIPKEVEQRTLAPLVRSFLWLDEAFIGIDPLLWIVGAAILFIGLYKNSESPLDKWAKQSPFAKGQSSSETDQSALADLLNVLFTPSLQLNAATSSNKAYRSITLDLNLPFFTPNEMNLQVNTNWQKIDYQDSSSPLTDTGSNFRQVGSAQKIVPNKVEQRIDKNGNIQGMRYYYDNIPVGVGENPMDLTRVSAINYQSQAKIVLSNYGCTLPPETDSQNPGLCATLSE